MSDDGQVYEDNQGDASSVQDENEALIPAEPKDESLIVVDPFEDAAAQYAAQYDEHEPAADEGVILATATFANTAVLETPVIQDTTGQEDASPETEDAVVVPVQSEDVVQVEDDEPPQTFLGWVWASLRGRGYSQAMLRDLNAALADQPDMLTNLVLRGEIYLKRRDYAAAQADFEQALTVGEKAVRQARWGIVPQTMMDRAETGLREAQRT